MVHLGGYFEESLKLQLRAIAVQRKIPLSELFREILEAAVSEYWRRDRERKANLGKSSSSTSASKPGEEGPAEGKPAADPPKKKRAA